MGEVVEGWNMWDGTFVERAISHMKVRPNQVFE
jgi:hypothetical protein